MRITANADLQVSHHYADLAHYFGILMVPKFLFEAQVLRIGVHDEGAILHSAWPANVSSVTLEHDVQRLFPVRSRSGIDWSLSASVHADKQCILKVAMKGSPHSADPEETSQ